MDNNPIQSKSDYLALEGMIKSEGFAIFSRLLTAEMNKEYNSMMNKKAKADDIKEHRDNMLGLKFALDIGKTMLDSYKGKFDEE